MRVSVCVCNHKSIMRVLLNRFFVHLAEVDDDEDDDRSLPSLSRLISARNRFYSAAITNNLIYYILNSALYISNDVAFFH